MVAFWNLLQGFILVHSLRDNLDDPDDTIGKEISSKTWQNNALHRRCVICRFLNLGLHPHLGERGRSPLRYCS
jgi:hypothetical protein